MTHKELAIKALESMKGDDLLRARAAFRGCTESEMGYEYGMSGKTRRQILAEYEEHAAQVDAAIAWVRSAS